MKAARVVILAIAACVLSACSVLVSRDSPATYALSLQQLPVASATPAPGRWQLSVAEPHAISPLDGTRIAVMPRAGEMQTYKDARWRDTPPVMLQQLLLQAFRDAQPALGTGTPAAVLHTDFALQSELLDFQAEYRGAQLPTIVFRISTQLVEPATGFVVANRTFVVEQASAGSAMNDVLPAFQDALNRLLPQIVAWTIENVDARVPAR